MRADEAIFCWPMGSWHGWGIRGLNYALHWPGTAVSANQSDSVELGPDDPRLPLLRRRLEQSKTFQDRVLATGGPSVGIPDAAVMVALPNNLRRAPVAYGRWLSGTPTIACPVFEDLQEVEANVERLKPYDRVIVASRWNKDALATLGVGAILVHEGIDPILFNPMVRRPRSDGRFRVFSGGKTEYRKGQDIVIDAFRIFAEKHDDAVLVCAWGSPWGTAGEDFEGKWWNGAPPGTHIGKPNFGAWLQKAGLKPHQYEIVAPRPNWAMPEVYGGVDVAVFPSRREGGTNFVAMECMACGVPTIRSPWHGHADLLNEAGMMTSDHDADDHTRVVEWLHYVYHHGFEAKPLSEHWTWQRHCKQMAGIISDV